MAALDSSPVHTRKRVMGPPLPFTAVENDPDIAPVLEVSAQLFVPVQAAAGDYEEEHVSESMSRIAAGLRVIREITHPRIFDRFSPGTQPSGGEQVSPARPSPWLRWRRGLRWRPSRRACGLRARRRWSRLPT